MARSGRYRVTMPHPIVRTPSIPHEVPHLRRTCGGMSKASSKADTRVESWLERWQHWIAVLVSALLHLLFLFLMMLSSRIAMTPPQGTAGGSRMVVDFIGATPPQPERTTPAKPAARKSAAKRPRGVARPVHSGHAGRQSAAAGDGCPGGGGADTDAGCRRRGRAGTSPGARRDSAANATALSACLGTAAGHAAGRPRPGKCGLGPERRDQ